MLELRACPIGGTAIEVFVEQHHAPKRYPQRTFRDDMLRGGAVTLPGIGGTGRSFHNGAGRYGEDEPGPGLQLWRYSSARGNRAIASSQVGQQACAGLKACTSGTTSGAERTLRPWPDCQAVAPMARTRRRGRTASSGPADSRSRRRAGAGSSHGSWPAALPLPPSGPLPAGEAAQSPPLSSVHPTWGYRPALSGYRLVGKGRGMTLVPWGKLGGFYLTWGRMFSMDMTP